MVLDFGSTVGSGGVALHEDLEPCAFSMGTFVHIELQIPLFTGLIQILSDTYQDLSFGLPINSSNLMPFEKLASRPFYQLVRLVDICVNPLLESFLKDASHLPFRFIGVSIEPSKQPRHLIMGGGFAH